MIDVKSAVNAARSYLHDLYSDYDIKPSKTAEMVYEVSYPLLEEVELSEDEKYWLITFSLLRTQAQMAPVEMIKGTTYERVYKTVKIDAQKGEAVALKIRQL